MSKYEKLSDVLEVYSELRNPLLDAVIKTLSVMHGKNLPFALELMLSELFYKQNAGDTCIRAEAESINRFYEDLFNQHRTLSEDGYYDTEPFSPLISKTDIELSFDDCFDLIGSDESSNKPLILDLDRLYIRRNLCYEKQIADFIKKASGDCSEQKLGEDDINSIKSLLDVLFERADDDKSRNQEFDMQKIAAAMAAVSHFCIITGGPGTGKTTTVAKLLLLLQKLNPSKNNILLCAPTGKAAGRMTESIKKQFSNNEPSPKIGSVAYSFPKVFADENEREDIKNRICKTAVTVDKLLGSIPHKAHKIRNADNKIDCDILIVDEVSMVDAANFAKLCAAIREDTKVIMLGDKDQLASVEAGSVLNDLCVDLSDSTRVFDDEKLSVISSLTGYSVDRLKTTDISNNTVQLNFSYRFSDYKGIGDIAGAVNEVYRESYTNLIEDRLNKPFLDYKDQVELKEIKSSKSWRENNSNLVSLCSAIVSDYGEFWKSLDASHYEGDRFTGITEELAKKIFKELDKYRILCSNRGGLYGIQSINEQIEKKARNELNTLNAKASSIDSEWFIGKVILVTKNNYALRISNGDVGFVAAERKKDGSAGPLKVWFGDENSVFNVSPVFLTDYESGYAMTIHKSQGSEYDKVCMILSTDLNPVMTKELVYTGITRAKKHVCIYSDRQVFLDSCKRRVTRESGLSDRL
ncbi:DNA helicase/exodeoxyribonuclease V, alpha subunit [Succinivibrio dextrinosolvens DSM 3072]|uniref:RecBCD enzyme subunit RecD n=1 Tax=Succinivibrio dextrinosolvens DSM 3072 TaxID=1123324 RepID=A0A1T4UZA7_9GAMM|nr:exodeoxyribonuclease V subunit alpha [Succinivibrio dextrinosolvens]SKA57974.1 DNA helicase/exodeoxyribonuclease V, alpha subunit [Succinivibrio dextrinosolvens DSM 3072]